MNLFNILVMLKSKYPNSLDPDCLDPKKDPTKLVAERFKGIVQRVSTSGGHFRYAERKAKAASVEGASGSS